MTAHINLMQIFKSTSEIRTFLAENAIDKTVGFVPTMGALHYGHAALVERSISENDITICSIFVNPLQFNRKEDLDTYPDRILEDKKLLEELNCDILFRPSVEDIYFDEERLEYDFGSIGKGMEAEYRPGHFAGVAEVIHRFFKILRPDRAYFGEKDYQQLAIVRWLVEHYHHKTKIIPCATIRDESGLAMSSRNYNLSPNEYHLASKIYQILSFCKENKKNYAPTDLERICFERLQDNFKPEYFTIADQFTMVPLKSWEDSEYPRAFVAAYCGKVRLIDNLSLIS